MCGLIGAFRADDAILPKVGHFMMQGLYMSALRGMGGTGVGIVHREYDTDYAKSHASAPNFLCSEEWDWCDKNFTGARAILGHTRSATRGDVATKNSHPFQYPDPFKSTDDSVLMIHNGHIKNCLVLTPNGFNHAVDSAHVAHSLWSRGPKDTLEMLDGAFTLVWYDRKTKSMNLARNEERELFYCQNKDKTMFWFASELEMLASVLVRNSIEHVDQFYQLEKHTWYKFELGQKKLLPIKTPFVEKKGVPFVSYPNANGGPWKSGNGVGYADYTKQYPNPSDYIWCNVADEPDVALRLYKDIGEGEDQVAEKDAFGYVVGTRSATPGAVVRVNGIPYLEWKNYLQYIKNCVPCKITRVERDKVNQSNGKKFTYFECVLDPVETKKEIAMQQHWISQSKLHKHATDTVVKNLITNEAAREAAAGRVLPGTEADGGVPLPQSPVGASDPLGVGVHVGPDDGGDSGGPRTALGIELENMGMLPGPSVQGPYNRKISLMEWDGIAQLGCYSCGGDIRRIDVGKVEWWEFPMNPEDRNPADAEFQMICPCCKDNPAALAKMAV